MDCHNFDEQAVASACKGATPCAAEPPVGPGRRLAVASACKDAAPHAQDPCGQDLPTLVLKVSYDGTSYAGFALQEKQPHVRTVAGELTRALETLLRSEVGLTCAGRTDAGVHALGQYVSLSVDPAALEGRTQARVLGSLSALLPPDIRVSRLFWARPGFSARFDARARSYRYRLVVGPVSPVFNRSWTWWLRRGAWWDLDVDGMSQAAQALVGEHDFKSFCISSSAQGKPTCRNVSSIGFCWEESLGERILAMDITGNAFLHSMVRTIMGTLVEVGSGRRPAQWVAEALAACDRRAAGPCAPACGLTFMDVKYDEGDLLSW